MRGWRLSKLLWHFLQPIWVLLWLHRVHCHPRVHRDHPRWQGSRGGGGGDPTSERRLPHSSHWSLKSLLIMLQAVVLAQPDTRSSFTCGCTLILVETSSPPPPSFLHLIDNGQISSIGLIWMKCYTCTVYHRWGGCHVILLRDAWLINTSESSPPPRPLAIIYYYHNNFITVPSRKRAHGRCTLHWIKIGGWADIRGISIAFRRERAPR